MCQRKQQTCPDCGHVGPGDKTPTLGVTCEECGMPLPQEDDDAYTPAALEIIAYRAGYGDGIEEEDPNTQYAQDAEYLRGYTDGQGEL